MDFIHRLGMALVLLALVVFGAIFSGASVPGVPESVRVPSDEAVTISFSLVNSAGLERSPSTQFLAPTGYFFTGVPGEMASNASSVLSLTIQPNPDLSGQEFRALIRVRWSDGELESVPLTLLFEEPVESAPSPIPVPNALAGFASLGSGAAMAWLDLALLLVALVLLVAVAVRIRNRFFRKKGFLT